MQLRIKATKFDLTPAIKEYVQKKMDMVEKFLGDIPVINADFEVEMTTRHHGKGEIFRAEVNLELKGELIRIEKEEEDIYKAIDNVKEHLARAITKYKEKRIDRKREIGEIDGIDDIEDVDDESDIKF